MPLSTDKHKAPGSSIYAALADRLRDLIRSGNLVEGDRIGSEHELSRDENISRMTVRKASDLLISEGLVERRPGKGLYVRGVAPLTSGTIQIVAGNLLWETAMQMARGVQQAASSGGTHVQLYDAHGDVEMDLSLIDQLPSGKFKGAVIISLNSPPFSAAICRLHASGYPFVLLDQRMRDIDVSSVTADNNGGGFQMAQHLLANGHRNVAFIGDLVAVTVQERLAGFRDGLAEGDVVLKRSMIFDLLVDNDRFGDWSTRIHAATRQAMNTSPRPTAIFCSCDAIAKEVYTELTKLGLHVPRDVSVAGFDDDPLASYLVPSLTTIRQPFTEMGKTAMDLLRQRIATPNGPAEFRPLPVQLIERESVRKLG